ncbi:hypothetical protein ACYFX5_11535 [Bremerella sp. T1]|uniref:hypothetical protein n=1 Tax=Bremerella sp. TYQ1 TaxID=3119568 RepID=UPI001CCBF31E|nr:hypothetical protein [Bremerella volcania]UBM33705.1 hypothetical protein LA756_13480 [Bremerella volcania]
MRAFCYWLICMALLGVMACSSQKANSPSSPQETANLTLESWHQLPPHEKYDGATLERLRMHDEKLVKSNRAWKKFMNEVVIPEMKKDIPPPANH